MVNFPVNRGRRTMKVLIVEDNELMRYTIRTLLLKLGHEVAGEAEDAESALKAYAELKPEVVFLDLLLPGRSGLEILGDIRALDPAARVVILTAVDQTELDRRLSDKGVVMIIRKPFSYEEFKESVNRIAADIV
jgi:two-component system chemotaxis response regulator CheY